MWNALFDLNTNIALRIENTTIDVSERIIVSVYPYWYCVITIKLNSAAANTKSIPKIEILKRFFNRDSVPPVIPNTAEITPRIPKSKNPM